MKKALRIIRKVSLVLLTAVAVIIACGCTKDPDNGGNGGGNGGGNNGNTYNGHEYVDLGLPSGTLWATCNVGADTPEGFGDYFAWGETTPKTTYEWANYKYCNGGENQLTKYCCDANYGYNGFTDDLTTLQLTDDAATANWGSGWCIPTKEQWEELKNNTVSTEQMMNGVSGRLFTSSNGKTLFLPASSGNTHVYDGYYWSNSLYTENPYRAWRFYIGPDGGCGMSYYGGRCLGRSVRPVRSAN